VFDKLYASTVYSDGPEDYYDDEEDYGWYEDEDDDEDFPEEESGIFD
jgi:hypothetical protein